jgi:DNA-binding SARP family transcriptional activator
LLLVNRNRVVSMDAMIEAVWEENPPPAIVSSVHVTVSALRRVLSSLSEDARPILQTAAPGYRLNVADSACDLARSYARRDLGLQHFRAGRYDRAATDLRESLDLWRGAALGISAGSGSQLILRSQSNRSGSLPTSSGSTATCSADATRKCSSS